MRLTWGKKETHHKIDLTENQTSLNEDTLQSSNNASYNDSNTKKKRGCLVNCLIILLGLFLFALLIGFAWIPGIIATIYFAIKTTDKKEKFKKMGISVLITLFSFLVFSASTSETLPTAIEVQWNQTDYDINESPKLELSVTPSDATIDSLDISENDIATLKYADGQAIVTFTNEGTETITFIVNGSIESNATTITVVDQAKKEAEEQAKKKAEEEAKKKAEEEAKKKAEEEAKKKAEEETKKKAEEEAKKKAEEKAKKKAEEEAKKKAEEQAAQAEAERIAAEQAEAERIAAEQAASQQPQEEMVWIPATGSKYHSRSSCSNMKNPSQVTISEAQRRGYSPCKKCY